MLGTIVSALALGQLRVAARRAKRNALLSLAAGFLFLVGAVFVLAAAFIGLAAVIPVVWVALIFGVLFLFAGTIVLLFRRTAREPVRPGNAAFLGALGGGATVAATDDDGPPPRGPRRGWTSGLAGKAVIALPLIAFAAAVVAGRRSR